MIRVFNLLVICFLVFVRYLYFLVNPFFYIDLLRYLIIALVLLMIFMVFFSFRVVNSFYINGFLVALMLLFLMILMLLGFFTSNLFMFYFFFELSVIPIFVFILSWGGSERKIEARYYLFFFTIFSSLLFFWGLLNLYDESGSFSLRLFVLFNFLVRFDYLYFLMALVFFVKIPIFFFHIWLPLAHVERPIIGSIILASLMLKLGGYGLIRMNVVFFYMFFFIKVYFFVWGI